MSEHEDYLNLHNTVVGIYYDMLNDVTDWDEVLARLKTAIEKSAGMSFEEMDALLTGKV